MTIVWRYIIHRQYTMDVLWRNMYLLFTLFRERHTHAPPWRRGGNLHFHLHLFEWHQRECVCVWRYGRERTPACPHVPWPFFFLSLSTVDDVEMAKKKAKKNIYCKYEYMYKIKRFKRETNVCDSLSFSFKWRIKQVAKHFFKATSIILVSRSFFFFSLSHTHTKIFLFYF